MKHINARGSSASALVIILMVVVLMSALILAFFTRAQLQRQISFSSAGQSRAELLAQTGLETIKGELLEEIRAGSTVSFSNAAAVFIPLTNFTVTPQQVNNNGVTNLIKISSAAAPSWRSTNSVVYSFDGAIRSSPDNSTTNKARDGRFISLQQWLATEMAADTETNRMPAPDWVIVTRDGPVTASTLPPLAELSNQSMTNSHCAIGRYAYAIYDEGGLIDVNVAGFASSSITPTQAGRKGFLALADLAQIPNGSGKLTAQQIDELVSWRNTVSKSDYFNYLTNFSATNGYSRVMSGDQKFVNRGDLVRYAKRNGIRGALPYLATFSREKNAPSWFPRKNAADMGGSNGTNNIYAYKNLSESPSGVNRNLMSVRDANGKPFLKNRFPLNRLSILGNPAANVSNIKLYFGLTKTSYGWSYSHGSAGRILTLDEVRNLGRTPDFFELLKAGILLGSVAQDPGSGTGSRPPLRSTAADDHIIQIGTNIIDQFDTDNFPTTIAFSAGLFYGVEDLPYIVRALSWTYEDQPNVISMWLQPELWRPYQAPGNSVNTLPRVRVQALGVCYTDWEYMDPPNSSSRGVDVNFTQNRSLGQIEFNPSSIPRDKPVALTVAQGATSPNSKNINSGWPVQIAAIHTGDAPFTPDFSGHTQNGVWVGFRPSGSASITLEWLDGTTWRTYTQIQNVTVALRNALIVNPGFRTGFNNRALSFYGRPDPRTDRFGTAMSWCDNTEYYSDLSLRPDAGTGHSYASNFPLGSSFSLSGGNLGLLSDNRSVPGGFYQDLDGILRRAAGAYVDGTGTDGYPLIPSSASSRPIILNRPFQSVAELGYAYRDLPFKEIDFFSKESADSALLDLFCIYEEPEIVSGRVSLNTRRPEVLEAILKGSICKENDIASVLDADSPAIAQSIVNFGETNGPFLNRGDIVSEYCDELSAALSSAGDRRIKSQRESSVRALTDVTGTRTWNLLIDLIAQVGKYPANAASLNDFVVEGEKRFWLHIAIDRFTGQVIDQEYEAITD